MTPEISERLANRNIQLLSETNRHCLFARDGCIALVERSSDGLGSIGSTGLMTENGLAYLVSRDGRAVLAGKGGETPAAPEQIDAIRKFSEDLKAALGA